MRSRHTPGKLMVRVSASAWPTLVPVGEDVAVAQVDCSMRGENRSYDEALANAKRLVRCWNEHDGLIADNRRLSARCAKLEMRTTAGKADISPSRIYMGIGIHPAGLNSRGIRWMAISASGLVKADTLEGIKRLIRERARQDAAESRRNSHRMPRVRS